MPYDAITRKIDAGNIFNCEDLTEFVSSIVQVLPYKGASMSRFYMCEYEGVRFLTKLGFYHKTPPEIYGQVSKHVTSYIDAEINILKIFRDNIIMRNISPCILELVYEKKCQSVRDMVPADKVCERLILDYKYVTPEDDVAQLMCRYNDLVKNGLAHDQCAFLVLEKCDISLDEYLRKFIFTPVSLDVFKSLLFMIIYTIYAISKLYPGFRHYDLHTENIMLKIDPAYRFKATSPKFLVFTIDGETHSVPYFGIIPKIIDFGFSALPEEGIISNVTEDRAQMYVRSENDLLFLFHWIYLTLAHTSGDKLGRIDKLLSQLEPNRTYVQYYTEYIRKVEDQIPSYHNMVRNPVWDDYRKHKAAKAQVYNEYTPL